MPPNRLKVPGESHKYYALVLKVIERDLAGNATKCEILRDHESTHIEGGEQFHIIYASKFLAKLKSSGEA